MDVKIRHLIGRVKMCHLICGSTSRAFCTRKLREESRSEQLIKGYSWEIAFAFYTRVKTVQAARPRCHANRTSFLLLSFVPALVSNQEVAHRRKGGIFTYPWLYPRLSDSTLLLATVGPWSELCLGWRGKWERNKTTEGWRNRSQYYWCPFWSERNQRTGFEFKIPPHQMETMSMFVQVLAWTAAFYHSQHLHWSSIILTRLAKHIVKGRQVWSRPWKYNNIYNVSLTAPY